MRAELACAATFAALVFAGCGESDDPAPEAAAPAPSETTTPAEASASAPAGTTTPAATATPTPEPTAKPAGRASTASLRACLENGELLDEGEAPPGGDPRLGLDVDNARYAGFVVWPSGALADVYVAASAGVAERTEKLYERFLARLGAGKDDAGELVTAKGNLVVASDDERTPTAAEIAELDCSLTASGRPH